MQDLKVKCFTEDAILPTRAHDSDAGLDFYSPVDILLPYGKRIKINTHIGIALEEKTVGLFQDRSSMGNSGVRVLGGVIDANYRGEIHIILAYVAGYHDGSAFAEYDGNSWIEIKRGDKIAQMIITPIYTPVVVEVSEFETTDRNDNGFGSSGR